MTVLRPIGYEDRLSVVDHLDELRKRLFVCIGALVVAFCVCFALNHPLINALNRALPASAKAGLGDQAHQNATLHSVFDHIHGDALGLSRALANAYVTLPATAQHPAQRLHVTVPGGAQAAAQIARNAKRGARALPATASAQEKPIVIGPMESFTTTLMVAAYFALMITLPIVLYQLYAFMIPALSKDERRLAVPSMIAAPLLFVAGCVFSYFAVVPPAMHFLQGYNASEFQVLLQAKSFYKFEILLIMGIGLVFEVPLVLLALQKAGVLTANTLTLNWRYALVVIAVLVAALPGVDPVTMAMETLPLIGLYVLSIFLLRFVEYRDRRRVLAEARRATRTPPD